MFLHATEDKRRPDGPLGSYADFSLYKTCVVLQIRKICNSPSQPERIDSTLSLLNNETDELKILEATKLLMFDRAVQLHRRMSKGEDVPIFAMLLFARDSCDSPRRLLTNHLNRTGDTGGLEQVNNRTPPSTRRTKS